MDLRGWLLSLGLQQYETAFRENDIDETLLPSLTAQDLKDIGVVVVGHRRKLLNAIAALPANSLALRSDRNAALDASLPDTAERRQVTVMFADLVGSTALSTRMDPEDLREVISAYRRCVAETVRQLGGFVSQYLGDGVLIFFGYPQAHEDDAERAVRAALQLVAAVGDLKTHAVLQTRVGIATGLVVVGEMSDAGGFRERGIVGETPNLAARLQSLAEPNQVVIADNTRRLLGNIFELEDLGTHDLKGLADATRAWAVLQPSSVASRFEAMHASRLTDLIGRDEEIGLLSRRWARAKSGEGQVVLLSGEAGIGKSRLTAALLEHIGKEPHGRLRYFCSPHHSDSALYPIIGHLERVARFAYTDPLQTKLDKLDRVLAYTGTTKEDAALFAEMLALPNDGRYPTLQLTPEQRRQKTLEKLWAQVEVLARQNPVLMIFEDAHWSDPTSLEAISRAVSRVAGRRILLIVTFRPEFDPPWVGRPHVTALTLNRLPEREVGMMIDRVVGNKPLAMNVRRDIIERTDGVPLFVEEITRAVIEAESAAERAIAAILSTATEVPASLHASLMARLDRLGPAKEVAQIGAAIGREFSHALLSAVAQKPEAQLESSLDALLAAGLLFRQGTPPDVIYLFKHALVQDAAHGTLLREPRRALHARIAAALEDKFADIVDRRPEVLARHCTEAGLIEKAAHLWGKAGQRSLYRSALIEAVEQLSRALAHIAALPSTPELRREQIRLQVALVNPLMHVKGYAAAETRDAAKQARRLIQEAESQGEPPDEPLLLFSVLYGFWVANYVAFNGDVIRELATQFLGLADERQATLPLVAGHRLMGVSFLHAGEIVKARAHLDKAIELYQPAEHRRGAMLFGQDVRVAALFYRSLALWQLGYPDAAIKDAARSVVDARDTGQAANVMAALAITSLTHMHCGNYSLAKAQLDEVCALAEEKSAMFWKVGAMLLLGCLSALNGKATEAVKTIGSGMGAWRSTGASLWMPMHLAHLIGAYADVGHFDQAQRCVDEAVTLMHQTKERWYESDIHRIAGEVAMRTADTDLARAEALFGQALDVARTQQAKSFELRAAMSLARLWREQKRYDEARGLLAPIYNWYSEGFDTHDLRQARDLLGKLA
jgi:class 3 adenylate cyclase/predicted ATPase